MSKRKKIRTKEKLKAKEQRVRNRESKKIRLQAKQEESK